MTKKLVATEWFGMELYRFISLTLCNGLRSAFMTGAGIGMMFYMSPQLALVSLGVVPPVAAWGVVMGRKVRSTSRSGQ